LGDDIPDEKYQDMLDLASHIVESKAGHFDHAARAFLDH
jgi:non-homologous end joining protein Ku